MASSKEVTVPGYLASLPPEQRKTIETVRKVIKKNLPKGFEEGMQFGMISYCVPASRLADTYNGQPLGVAALAAQKNYYAIYLMSVYGDPATERWFKDAYKKSGKKLDMGKSCVRFRSLDDLPLDVIGQVIARVGVDDFVARYQAVRAKVAKAKAKR